MKYLKSSLLLLSLIFLFLAYIIWSYGISEDKGLRDTCLSLYSRIDQSPGVSSIEEPDYEAYAGLNVPPLPPEQALERFELEEGFRIEIIAHEPMVIHPVAMDIDADGRIWLVDMPSYMPVVDKGDWETAIREQVPQARIVILEDTNGDGKMDKKRIFRDEMILPRAIKVLSDGVLVIEPPNVWFIEDTTGDGKGDSRKIIDNTFGDPNVDNVESMPNGLMWGLDNWIHSAENNTKSLRRVDGQWQTRPFQRLGQWGMTQDDWGRLYSANNTRPLQTHFVPYGYSGRHPHFNVSEGKNITIAANNPLWPAHPVVSNRSYRVGEEVRVDGRHLRATSTLGPVIYRGDQFGDEYRGNAFTPEPAANLIKRYILDNDPAELKPEAHFAYEGKEFLTSTDERFRPVNMYNAPDGSIYVLDMYHGVIQHARFLTDHLRSHILAKDLHKGNGKFGRIYRIVRDDRPIDYEAPGLSKREPSDWVELLRHRNGHLRDQAQQLLVQCSPEEAVSSLESLTREASEEAYTRLQALWTLEGFDRAVYSQYSLTELALYALNDPHPRMRAAAIRILEPVLKAGDEEVHNRLEAVVENESAPFVQLQLLASIGESGKPSALEIMARILDKYEDSPYFREIAFTGVFEREEQLARILREDYYWSPNKEHQGLLLAGLEEIVEDPDVPDLSHLTEAQRQLFESGNRLYQTCAACHGSEGRGVSGVATPLAGSEWVVKDPEVIVRITLQGFTGGADERPRAENITGSMPPHGFLSDEDIAAILTYIRKSWGNDAPVVEPEEVTRIREESENRREMWTPDELRALIQ